ncbi:replication initiation protein [Paracoccus liaowanqingii]|uniref:Replication initiation protein n=1 Tax=Paracoccus liaowanqingii TaxID=2560053 RepID=A0A4Z1CQ03_9RHOB|nr:plasmid replication protein RepC [Paracoccus liaowanqingii]TGN67113.1 replication initiation protein [Paracoccus liaowanqingii]
MRHISMTPFGRQPVDAGLLATHALAEAPAPQASIDKWALLRDLTTARAAFGISDRDLVVLSALLSFHPAPQLVDGAMLVVFPSNASLAQRAHGMAESTLRRHLAALVRAGLILRRDSPNGKRYARRERSGTLTCAFGFDLRPLLVRAPDIAHAAEDAREADHALRCLREAVILRLRDLTKLVDWAVRTCPMLWCHVQQACTEMQRRLRRKLSGQDLSVLDARIEELMVLLPAPEITVKTVEMGGSDVRNERHEQRSNKDILESESCDDPTPALTPSIPLEVVLKAAPEIASYAVDPVRTWRDLIGLAAFVAPMMGITKNVWQRACNRMGSDTAAVTLACLLQRGGGIASPGAYLRRLTDQAEDRGFSAAPMVMALIRAENRQAV